MRKTMHCATIAGLAAITLALPAASLAASNAERIGAPEKDQAEIYHTLEEKKQAGLMTNIAERITMSGLIEVEAFYEDLQGERDEHTSDLELATVQLGFEAAVSESVTGTIIFLYEEGGSGDIEIDEATINYFRDGWYARLGKQYVPFGVYPSHFISDPLTLEIGETSETALLVGFGTDLFDVSLYGARGDADRAGDEEDIDDWGASLAINPADGVTLSASYHSDMADSDAELAGDYTDRVGAWSVAAVIEAGAFEISTEYLAAADSFNPADLDADGDGDGDRPSAWVAEFAWRVRDNIELAGRFGGSGELGGQPELQYGACVSWGALENVSLSVEYIRGEFDDRFGEGADAANLLATQLAVEF